MLKIIIVISYLLNNGFDALIQFLDDQYIDKELPENVKDIYDEDEYRKWKDYQSESGRLDTISDVIQMIFLTVLLITNAYSWIFKLLAEYNTYLQYFIFIFGMTLINEVIVIPFEFYDTFVIEEKYGMNNSTKKTFFLDSLKGFVISGAVSYIFMALIMFIFERYGNMAILIGTISMLVIILAVSLVIVPLMKIFNKFTPLEDGPLKEKLLELCAKYGVKVRKIVVMDASKRTTKSNAFCAGLGNRKTISLDDNLVNSFEDEEIVAVFAHEFAHAKYKHTIRFIPFALIRMLLIFASLWIVLNIPALYTAFGFDGINYFFAQSLVMLITWPLSKGLDIISNYISRRHEYQADAFAAREGYGEKLIDSLKKLHKEAMSDINPHPAMVILSYSHPTLSQRITAIEAVCKDKR